MKTRISILSTFLFTCYSFLRIKIITHHRNRSMLRIGSTGIRRKFRFFTLATVLSLFITACPGTNDSGSDDPFSGTISGMVTADGSGLPGVTVSMSGAASGTTTTDANGNFTFPNLPEGTYSITLSGFPEDVSFPTTAKAATISVGQNSVTLNFDGMRIGPETLNIEKEGNGMVTNEDGQIDCGDNCSAEYDKDSEATLTATPADGWAFGRWEGDLTGDANPATITMDGNKTVTAIFVEEEEGVPGLHELIGSWVFHYMISDNTCNDQAGEFEVEANVAIMDEGERQIKIIFGNAPDHPLWGMYNDDGWFSGETDKVDVSGGAGTHFGLEFYDGYFARGKAEVKQKRPDHGIFFFGTSLFDVTDAEGEHYCKVEYDVEGEKTGE